MKTTTKPAFNKITSVIAFTCLMSASAFASANQSIDEKELKKQENTNNAVGFGTGVVFGAAVAGPVGAAVAGLFGLFIADDINDENRLELTKTELNSTSEELVALQKDYESSMSKANEQIAAMDSAMTKAIQQVSPHLETNIQFKTASYLIEDHYKTQLDGLASELRKNPGLKIELSGFADQRGESAYNQVLSEQRTKAVKDYLLSQFVNDNQIIAQAFGESNLASSNSSFEEDFFDRRVHVKVSSEIAEMTAANQ
ncbi:sortase-associated OmpA-like protein PdsO [Glaciecola sp. MH2013]|nr:sortase-associated OmpA-like protein PdsO [Glaciecola sp. MH2013]